jgi:hypothetical protein
VNIGMVYEAKDDFQQALSYYDQAAIIFRYTLSTTHPNVIKVVEAIKRVSQKVK